MMENTSSKEALSKEMDDLKKRLESKEQELRNAHREMESYLHAISHDLRAPLRAIMTSAMILQEDFGERLNPEGVAELNRQNAAAKKMNALLDEILKLSRLSQQEMHVGTVDLVPLAQQISQALSPEFAQSLQLPEAVTVQADPGLAALALKCVFENSWKFRDPSRNLKVRVTNEDGLLKIEDNGIGWDAEPAQRAFLPFERINGNDYAGLGMGLTTLKKIIDRHGGTVGADGALGERAVVWFSFGGR